MYIHEAVEKAVKENGKIIRSSARRPESDIYSEITPTNSYDACLITVLHDGKPRKTAGRWNPTADDLMADDWNEFRDKVSNCQQSFLFLILHLYDGDIGKGTIVDCIVGVTIVEKTITPKFAQNIFNVFE